MTKLRSEPNELGRPLTLVRDLMSVGVLTCSPDTPVIDLTRLLLDKDLEAAVVLDDRGHAVGVVSSDDLVGAYARGWPMELGEGAQFIGPVVEDVMQAGVPQVPPDIPLTAAAQIMRDQGIRMVFMMHHAGGIEYPAAMLSYKHLLRHLAMESEDDLKDLGIKAERESPLETFIRRRDEARRRAGLDE